MHIPDSILDAKTTVATGLLAGLGVGAALWTANRQLQPRHVPLLGVTAAFVFAAQMLNFPILPGVSGHLFGGALAAVLLGPAGAVIALTAVLAVQAFVFQDGGVTALGANIFNMGIVGPLAGYAVYRLRPTWWLAAVAGWLATVVAAVCCAAQLAWSGLARWDAVLPAMAGIHALIGVAEGIITGMVVRAIAHRRPELLRPDAASALPLPAMLLAAVAVVGVAWLVSPFICQWPDGLEQVAATLGFEHGAAR